MATLDAVINANLPISVGFSGSPSNCFFISPKITSDETYKSLDADQAISCAKATTTTKPTFENDILGPQKMMDTKK
uniref:Uncharacterized protein n=1 Tax=Romanomermis culicivorax TaxID=13658 RepID=A0A915I5U9_ROMCU